MNAITEVKLMEYCIKFIVTSEHISREWHTLCNFVRFLKMSYSASSGMPNDKPCPADRCVMLALHKLHRLALVL